VQSRCHRDTAALLFAAMKLDTAISQTVLREAAVVAGQENLGREITWVHMVDHPDIVNWVKQGELLLTTGYNWPSDADASRQLVRDLNEVGLAGVVLAVPHFRDHFPPEAIDEARNVGLPLLELPWDVQFSQVTHEILAKIIYLQAEIIERSEQLHRALTNAVVTANSLSDIANTLRRLVGREVTFTNLSGNRYETTRRGVGRFFVSVAHRREPFAEANACAVSHHGPSELSVASLGATSRFPRCGTLARFGRLSS
jgi:purine catabolism regulator